MKIPVLLSISLLLLLTKPGAVFCGERHAWTTSDTLLQSTFIGLTIIDWKQTREFTGNRHKYPDMYETNPLMGPHPSARKVNIIMATSIIAHTVTAVLLSKPYRTYWQGLWIAVEIRCIYANYRAGISIHF